MNASLEKLHKFLSLEVRRGYDNGAVVGGLARMLAPWEAEARAEGLPSELIDAVVSRLRDYAGLSPKSRAEVLQGLWARVRRQFPGVPPLEGGAETGGDAAQQGTVSEGASKPPEGSASPRVTPARTRRERAVPQRAVPPAGPPAALEAPVTTLPHIGPRRAKRLERLGIRTVGDLLYHLPRRYDDYSRVKPIRQLRYGEQVTVLGVVEKIGVRDLRGGKLQVVEAFVGDGSGVLRVTWFNQTWIAQELRAGVAVALAGKVDQYLGRLVLNNPEWEVVDETQLHTGRIVPVYPLTAQVSQRWLRQLMAQIVPAIAPRVPDPLPDDLRAQAGLLDLPTALMQVHFPDSAEMLRAARQRLAFDEVFYLQLGVLQQKQRWRQREGRVFRADEGWWSQQLARLPFTLTGAQQRALGEIRADLASGHPMNRLLQGDVGSGKTVVAALTIALVTREGAQAALMAPTAILAEQHYRTLRRLLTEGDGAPLPPEAVRLLVGSTPNGERREILEGLMAGRVKVLIGTHALIEEPVQFADLQLVVIDEQHRFGVRQRAALRRKGNNPHLLVMTATPIPRSLALTIYGDLDLTVMDEMPPGRKPVATYLLFPRERERVYRLIRKEVERGHQAFVIYPLIEESEALANTPAAVEAHRRLQEEVFPDLRVGLLHGQMRDEEKDAVMRRFRDGEYHILVSTPVVEVGVDVPNATVMVIEGANRFGLAQLHQFRGRVGRGGEQAYCILIPETEKDTVENERLQALVEIQDGFRLAEKDLEQRGPGEFFGTRQSGYDVSFLRLANLLDVRMIEKARQMAQAIFARDPALEASEHRLLAEMLRRRWRAAEGEMS